MQIHTCCFIFSHHSQPAAATGNRESMMEVVEKDRMLEEKDAELKKMQQMLAKMQEEMAKAQQTQKEALSRTNSGRSTGTTGSHDSHSSQSSKGLPQAPPPPNEHPILQEKRSSAVEVWCGRDWCGGTCKYDLQQ